VEPFLAELKLPTAPVITLPELASLPPPAGLSSLCQEGFANYLARISHTTLAKSLGFAKLIACFSSGHAPSWRRLTRCSGDTFHGSEKLFRWVYGDAAEFRAARPRVSDG
jgi:hypothetical protein